ncbi:hypothetical protein [Frateuria defendens]|uniref:hypothetical protein n=1 Tax=Frateuria defendens TaxID=2219559 RepID=UPI00066FFF34|nr:hypothetical protein [Frateuria defendens]
MNDVSMFASTAVAVPPAVSPLIERLAALPGSGWVGQESLEGWLALPGDAVLFVWGEPVRYPECTDVAVVLPELRAALGQGGAPRFRIGVVRADSEQAVAARYGVGRRPSLVFVRDGQYVDTVAGMCDWEVYLADAVRILAAPTRRPPGIGIPVRVEGAASGCGG